MLLHSVNQLIPSVARSVFLDSSSLSFTFYPARMHKNKAIDFVFLLSVSFCRRPTSVANSTFILATLTTGHVLSAHMHNWPSASRERSSTNTYSSSPHINADAVQHAGYVL